MEIVVTEVGPARFAARLNGELLCTSRTPLLSAARELQRRGVRDSAEIGMRNEGQDFVAMTTTVGAAARLAVEEGDMRFRSYKPFAGHGLIP
jgi:hypothetical protein